MKRTITAKCTMIVAFTILLTTALNAVGAVAVAIPDNTMGSGSTAAINDYQFQGTATLTIHGREKSADLLVTVLEPPVVDANGVQYVKATHQFTFADASTITTSDQEIATPTATPGLYTITANMQVASGTGIYEGASGHLIANGTIDFAAQPPAAQFELAGVILEDTTGSGSTAAINDYQFQGTATLTLRGQEKSTDLVVTVLEPPVVDANGVQYVKATHQFTFADASTITTSDQEIATPTATPGLYTITANMQVVSGTGIYEGAGGHLIANGTINFAAQPPAAQFELAGVILEDTTGSGSTAGINDYQFQGTAKLTIHGQEKSAELLVTVLEPPVVDANGVQYVKATHEFTFADGSSITTSDQEIATPTATPGLYTIAADMGVASGTGIYEGVRGRLIANGTINFAEQPPAAQFDLAGAVIENTTGSGATAAINDYQFAGTTTLTIQGKEKSADLVVTVLEPPVVDANGVQYVKATHEFTFADGSSITTSDQEVATPTATPGLYTITAQMNIASCTGIYEGAMGRLEANGTIDFGAQPPAARFDVVGGISFCGDANHPYPLGDLNQDCRVDYADLALLCGCWLQDNNP